MLPVAPPERRFSPGEGEIFRRRPQPEPSFLGFTWGGRRFSACKKGPLSASHLVLSPFILSPPPTGPHSLLLSSPLPTTLARKTPPCSTMSPSLLPGSPSSSRRCPSSSRRAVPRARAAAPPAHAAPVLLAPCRPSSSCCRAVPQAPGSKDVGEHEEAEAVAAEDARPLPPLQRHHTFPIATTTLLCLFFLRHRHCHAPR